ncbi:MAG: DUF1761 domain-containing protein [Pseudomonadota bacterium]
MLRLAGVNLIGVFLSAIAMFFIGFIWFGVLFQVPWMQANGMFFAEGSQTEFQWLSASGVQTSEIAPSSAIMGAGFVLSVVLSYGLGWHLKQKSITKLSTAVLFGLWLSLLIGVPLAAYDMVYTQYHSIGGFFVDAGYTVATFVAGCAVLSRFD